MCDGLGVSSAAVAAYHSVPVESVWRTLPILDYPRVGCLLDCQLRTDGTTSLFVSIFAMVVAALADIFPRIYGMLSGVPFDQILTVLSRS